MTSLPREARSPADQQKLRTGLDRLWHAAGFGMLYQITGEKKYADMGRQCAEKMLEGQRDEYRELAASSERFHLVNADAPADEVQEAQRRTDLKERGRRQPGFQWTGPWPQPRGPNPT